MSRVLKFRTWYDGLMYDVYQVTWDAAGSIREAHMENSAQRSRYHSSSLRGVTLMQFTGLTDKNGREVYEGDVVTWQEAEGAEGVVTWEPSVSGFMILHQDRRSAWVLHDQWEIIGNIYESPELLKGEAKV